MRDKYGIRIVLVFGLAMVLGEGPVRAGTLVETFDSLNPSLWTVETTSGASVELENGRLKCSIPNHSAPLAYAIITSKFVLSGAFSAQVDYQLTGPLLGTTAIAGVQAIPDNVMKCTRDTLWEYSAGMATV